MTDAPHTRDCRDSLTGLGDEDYAQIEAIYPEVYDDLRGMAERRMRRERGNHTLQPTALVNEVYLKLMDQSDASIRSKTHFVALASVAMQRILCDSGRARKAAKRGGGWARVDLDDVSQPNQDDELNEAMAEAILALSEVDTRKAAVVRLRFLGGLNTLQIAEALGVARSTVDADWAAARVWIMEHLETA